MKKFCVIPAYNEEKNIADVIGKVRPFVDEIVIVDDGSTDRTSVLAKQEKAIVLRHIINRGQGAALKTGTDYAVKNGAEIIIHFDADNQFEPSDIEAVAKPIEERKAEVVFGSRFLEKNSTNMPAFKKNIIMPVARIVNRLLLGVKLTDPQSGFRAMSIYAAKKIEWKQDRMAHCSEILFAATRKNLAIVEVPIRVTYYNFGQKFNGGIKILKDLFIASLLN